MAKPDAMTGPATAPARLTVKGAARAAAIGLAVLPLLPLQALAIRTGRGRRIPPLFHRWVCRALSVRVTVEGTPPARGERALIVANHVSWLDIPVVGSTGPLAFIAKSEIAGWPGIGLFARLQRTIFLDRSRRAATADIAAATGERLGQGERIVLFAEGTTGDGSRIMPFRSSLLGAVRQALGNDADGEILIQPLAVLYLGRNGLPGGRAGRAALAWYGDTELAPHLVEMLNGGPIDVRLVWGEPIRMGRDGARKEVARAAEAAVRQAAVTAFTGRQEREAPVEQGPPQA
jgi:1-acyl-sn-glycerol-3-phosphate acyltransferase